MTHDEQRRQEIIEATHRYDIATGRALERERIINLIQEWRLDLRIPGGVKEQLISAINGENND